MNKKVNTLLFVLGGTLFNLVFTTLFFFAFMWFYGNFIHVDGADYAYFWLLLLVFLIVSLVLSSMLYRLLIKLIMKRIDMDKYFSPLFARKYPSRNSDLPR